MNQNKKVHVQQWVDNLPPVSPITPTSPLNNAFLYAHQRHKQIVRDASVQSDCSHCSSVESVLEFRRPDPEAVLIGLGFGPRHSSNYASRIPERFLQPSKVIQLNLLHSHIQFLQAVVVASRKMYMDLFQLIKHIDINKFLEEHGQTQMLDQ